MRHGKKINHLGRTASHRKAMLRNMAISLLEHKRIITTVAKAKALRKYIEPLVTKAKNADAENKDTYTHARRVVFSYLQNKEAIKELFDEVVPKVADRPGGYTRILRLGNRPGDNAEMAFIEFVDFNEYAPGKVSEDGGSRRRRRRRRGKKSAGGESTQTQPQAQQKQAAEEVEKQAEEAATTSALIEDAEVVEEVTNQPEQTQETPVEETSVEETPTAEAAEETPMAESSQETPAQEESPAEESEESDQGKDDKKDA